MIKLVVALGNPGKEYSKTRHNIGWMVVDELVGSSSLAWKEKNKSLYYEENFKGEKIIFLKPQTFMNLSGQPVAKFASFFKINPSEILVLHDELDINFGKIVFKKGGGVAGHNGLKSIVENIGSKDFYRIRLGISRPEYGDVSSWVLSKFSKDEVIVLEKFIKAACDSLKMTLEDGYEKAAGNYSNKSYI